MTNGTIQENGGLATGTEMRTVGGGTGVGGDGFTALMSIDPDRLLFTGVITRTSVETLKGLEYEDPEAAKIAGAANRLLDLAVKLQSGKSPISCHVQIGLHLGDDIWHTSHCQVVEDSRSRVQAVRQMLVSLASHLESVS